MDFKNKKIVIFDGISGAPMGKELLEEFRNMEIPVAYIDGQKLAKKPLYKVRASAAKSINKVGNKDSFYHFPKFKSSSLEARLTEEKPDYVLVIGFTYRFVAPTAVKILKEKLGFSLFLYDTDSCNFYSRRREFVFFLENELPIYDRIFSFSKVTTGFFKNTLGLPATFLPFGAKLIPCEKPIAKELDVLFVGSADLRRIFLLEKISGNLTAYGNRWKKNMPLMSQALQKTVNDKPVWGSELHELLFKSKIVLNITRTDFYGAETGINLRIFEALAAGCFLLTDYCDELKDIFNIGEEIEVFRSSDELVEKVNYYLEHDEEREAIARRGHERFCRDYTWRARMEKLLQHIEAGS